MVNYQRDIGVCVCDLTRNACDPNCCCDTDCTAAEISSYFKGGCFPSNGGNASAIPICNSNLVTVNHASDIPVVVSQGVNHGLCVALSNSAITGTFFSDVGVFTTESLFLEKYNLNYFPIEDSIYNLVDEFKLSSTYYHVKA